MSASGNALRASVAERLFQSLVEATPGSTGRDKGSVKASRPQFVLQIDGDRRDDGHRVDQEEEGKRECPASPSRTRQTCFESAISPPLIRATTKRGTHEELDSPDRQGARTETDRCCLRLPAFQSSAARSRTREATGEN